MSNKLYRITCSACNDENMYERVGSIMHTIGTLKIVIVDVPYFFCTTCNNLAYRKTLNMGDILSYAFKNGLNMIVFEESDYEEL